MSLATTDISIGFFYLLLSILIESRSLTSIDLHSNHCLDKPSLLRNVSRETPLISQSGGRQWGIMCTCSTAYPRLTSHTILFMVPRALTTYKQLHVEGYTQNVESLHTIAGYNVVGRMSDLSVFESVGFQQNTF